MIPASVVERRIALTEEILQDDEKVVTRRLQATLAVNEVVVELAAGYHQDGVDRLRGLDRQLEELIGKRDLANETDYST